MKKLRKNSPDKTSLTNGATCGYQLFCLVYPLVRKSGIGKYLKNTEIASGKYGIYAGGPVKLRVHHAQARANTEITGLVLPYLAINTYLNANYALLI
jgi:hypothetical protein